MKTKITLEKLNNSQDKNYYYNEMKIAREYFSIDEVFFVFDLAKQKAIESGDDEKYNYIDKIEINLLNYLDYDLK